MFSLNFDPVAYWVAVSSPQMMTDGFSVTEDELARRDIELPIAGLGWRSGCGRPDLLYLHGAAHLFDFGGTEFKLVRGESEPLRDRIDKARALGMARVAVVDGEAGRKRDAISASAYLSEGFAHFETALRGPDATLVVYGASLAKSDQHLVDAIAEAAPARVWLGVHGSEPAARLSEVAHRLSDAGSSVGFYAATEADPWAV